jgi:hypothetical protein
MRNQAALYPGGLFCGLPRNQVSGVSRLVQRGKAKRLKLKG